MPWKLEIWLKRAPFFTNFDISKIDWKLEYKEHFIWVCLMKVIIQKALYKLFFKKGIVFVVIQGSKKNKFDTTNLGQSCINFSLFFWANSHRQVRSGGGGGVRRVRKHPPWENRALYICAKKNKTVKKVTKYI